MTEIEKLEDFVARNKARVATRGMANSRAKKLDKMEEKHIGLTEKVQAVQVEIEEVEKLINDEDLKDLKD